MDVRILSPLVIAGAALAILLPSAPILPATSPSALGEPKAKLDSAACEVTVMHQVMAAPTSAAPTGTILIKSAATSMTSKPTGKVGASGLVTLTGKAQLTKSSTGACPTQAAGKIVVAQPGSTPTSVNFASPAPIAAPLLDPEGDDERVKWLYGICAVLALTVAISQWARPASTTIFANPNDYSRRVSPVYVLTGAKWTYPGALGTALTAAGGITTTIVAAKLITTPALLDQDVYAAHALIMGLMVVLASVVFNVTSVPLAVRLTKNVQDEGERMRVTPVFALYVANALLVFGTVGLLLLGTLLVLDLELAALLPSWLGYVVAIVLVGLAPALVLYTAAYTRRMRREQGFQIRGFHNLQAAVNWGFDATDVTPQRVDQGDVTWFRELSPRSVGPESWGADRAPQDDLNEQEIAVAADSNSRLELAKQLSKFFTGAVLKPAP